jgi:hypothetical protein
MKILIACEESGIVREAFRKAGHDAWSCDLLLSAIQGQHYQGNVLDIIQGDWSIIGGKPDMLIGHPPCTYLTNAGVRHLYDHVVSRTGKHAAVYGAARWTAMKESAIFFRQLLTSDVERIAIENPIPHKYAVEEIGRKYDQLIQPWWFGHGETKATCFWLKNLPKLVPTDIVEGREHRIHKMPPSVHRSKDRSKTFQGIADAMAAQWG